MTDTFELKIELNDQFWPKDLGVRAGGAVLTTPPIDENFWVVRVRVSEKQAIVGFPKFGLIGVGFQHETDWNTNLPSMCDAKQIFDHIAHNKGDATIPDERCIRAIQMLKDFIAGSK